MGTVGSGGTKGDTLGFLPLLKLCDDVLTVELVTRFFKSPSLPFLSSAPLPYPGDGGSSLSLLVKETRQWGLKTRATCYFLGH